MPQPLRKTFADALSMPPRDRLELATELLDSVEGVADPEWEAAWTLEIERRRLAADTRGERGTSWAEARARLISRLTANGVPLARD